MEHCWAQKCKSTKIPQNLPIDLSEILPDAGHSKVGKSDSLGFLRKIFITILI